MSENVMETGVQLLARLGARPSLEHLEDALFPTGINQQDVIELYGDEGTGKTQTMLHLVANCILPKTWKSKEIGGLEASVVFIDTDCQLCMLHLTTILETRITRAVEDQTNPDTSKQKVESMSSFCEEEVEKLIKNCLQRLYVVKCHSSTQLIVTIYALEELLSNKPEIALILLDGLSSFYWQDRSSGGDNISSQESNQAKVSLGLKKLISTYNLVLIASKLALFMKRKESNTENETKDCPMRAKPKESGAQEHCEYLSKVWQKLVTKRCIFQKLDKVPSRENQQTFSVRVHVLGHSPKFYKRIFRISNSGLHFVSP